MSISGKFLTAFVNGAEVIGTFEGDVTEQADKLEATTGTDEGRGRKDPGVVDTIFKVTLYCDVTNGSFAALRAGNTLTDVEFWLNRNATSPIYVFEEARAFNLHVRGQIRDRVIVDCEIEAYGDVVTQNEPN